MSTLSYGKRLSNIARQQKDAPAIIFVPENGADQQIRWHELDRDSNRLARFLKDRGAGPQTIVAIALGNTPLHVKVTYAAWKVGACVLPLNQLSPAPELKALIETAEEFRPVVSVGGWKGELTPTILTEELSEVDSHLDDPLPDIIPEPGRAIGSGATSGRPKIIMDDAPGTFEIKNGYFVSPLLDAFDLKVGDIQMVCTPLQHAIGFGWTHYAVMLGNVLILHERFDPVRVLDSIERHRVNHTMVVPSVLQRLANVAEVEKRDLSSLKALCHSGAPCAEWLKRRWIELVGPEHLIEGYGATEAHGFTVIRGDEWLLRPGSVGKPCASELLILDDDGKQASSGEVGEIFMRPVGTEAPPFRYIGADYRKVTADGFVTLGDYGWVDEEGYLYIADRRSDMIITGGANVYPSEVETVLSAHPQIADVAVIGLPDERWGRRIHAVVQPFDVGKIPSEESLRAFCRNRLSPYKVPKTYEFVNVLPRTDVGKISRARLIEERTGSSSCPQSSH